MSVVIQKRNNEHSRLWSKLFDSTLKHTKLYFCRKRTKWSCRETSFLQWETQVSWTAPAERQNANWELSGNNWLECQRQIVDQTELNKTRYNLQWYWPRHPFINRHKPEKFRRVLYQKYSPQWQTSIRTTFAAEPNWNYFSLPRKANRLISRDRSNVSSNWCPKRWQPMLTISLASRIWAEDGSIRVPTTGFIGKISLTCVIYALHQVGKDSAVSNKSPVKTVQRNFYMNNFPMSVRTHQEAIEKDQKNRDVLNKGGFKLIKVDNKWRWSQITTFTER